MKAMKKGLLIIVTIALLIGIFTNFSYAEYDWDKKIKDAAASTAPGTATNAITATRTISQSIITIARVISMGVAITMIIVLAIKYMSAAPGDKATIKKSAVTYVVGAIVMFASYGILTIIQEFAKGITATE